MHDMQGHAAFLFQSGAVLFLYGPALRQKAGMHLRLHIMSRLYAGM